MKKTNKKLIALLLGGMLSVATLGVGLMKADVVSAEETTATAKTYELSKIFATDASDASSVIGADKKGDENATVETARFTLSKGESVEFRRNLALKWYDEVETEGQKSVSAQYFTMKFSFANTNFDALSIVMESESAAANEDNKATNKVTFAKTESGNLTVAVNDVVSKTEIAAENVNDEMTLTLSEEADADYGTFNVVLNGAALKADVDDGQGGTKEITLAFENIGANYATYTDKKVVPLSIISEKEENTDGEEETTELDSVVYLYELNNQKFDNIVTEKSGDKDVKKVPDTAAPVIVINDDIADGLLIGTAFAYYTPTVIDVMPNSDSKITTRSFYQWNPTDTSVIYNTEMKSSHYFMETTYYLAEDGSMFATKTEAHDSGKKFQPTTVYKENGNQEFLSIKYAVQDDSMEEAKTTKEYQLAWYADDKAKETKDGIEYVYLNNKNEGATYKFLTLLDGKNVLTDEDGNVEGSAEYDETKTLAAAVAEYQIALETAATEAVAGSNSYIYFPSLAWLIDDNNGYRNLKFVICYKSPSSTTGKSTSQLSYNGLRLSTTDEGYYEFKVYATDAAGNGMQYYHDGELVTVNASNIWDIEEIPSFSYEIERKGVSIKNDSDTTTKRKDDVEFKGKFSGFSDPTVVGIKSKKSAYALYKVDTSIYNDDLAANKKHLTSSIMAGVTYASLKTDIDAEFKAGNIPGKGQYFDLYLQLYVKRLAKALETTPGEKIDIEKLAFCFIRIDEYDSSITEEDAEWDTNKFKWNSSSKSFEAVERCEYLIFADYYEDGLATQRIAAYKVIEVEAEEDVNYIKTKWIKDNITSVVLFAIAGVMFVMIIVLLLIKPSDETLEDVEEAADEQNEKKKEKKNRK